MAKDSPSQTQPKVQVRMEERFRQKLMEAAHKADRSLNAEIMARLEKSFEDDTAATEMAEKVEYLESQTTELWQAIEDLQRTVSSMYAR